MNKTLNNVELRRINGAPELRMEVVEREDGSSQKYISGYAVVFDQYSRSFYDEWIEIIDRNAFASTDMSDVVMVVDHSQEVGDVLARSRNGVGTLEIGVDERGVKFRFPVPDTTVGRDVVELIERGDISECSFAFWVKADEWRYDVEIAGKHLDERRILEVARLADLSIVVRGAYPTTSVEVDERALVGAMRKSQGPKSDATMSVSLMKMISNI
jgi:HK97 family phage prohead protease